MNRRRGAAWRGWRGGSIPSFLLALLAGCVEVEHTVHVAEAAVLELPPVPNAPARLQVVAYGPGPDARPELGRCATRVRDPVNQVDWTIDAAQSWETSEVVGDTTFVHHVTIGDYVPADLAVYGMQSGEVVRVDCAAYGVLGLARTGS